LVNVYVVAQGATRRVRIIALISLGIAAVKAIRRAVGEIEASWVEQLGPGASVNFASSSGI
jgi:hypothetical protein